ncbi:hypothetical protein [Virgibacillus oceani]|uniref:Uncharacterized protein n=1 Tax=Virgibacillus oceani TaxID=1479511 RepID=A0A917M4T7_9BACI|nr:hypothetical protein [Virgibacillus oceani]GGG75456.1 hypothetical protein GCM10011398_20350 [Virgibacillus oceani]
MSSYNSYTPGWGYYPEERNRNGNFGENQGQRNIGANETNSGKQSQMGPKSNGMGHNPTLQNNTTQKNGNLHGYQPFAYSNNLYNGTGSEMDYLIRMMRNLNEQLDTLTQLMAQNNQLLQTMHDQEDTKCVQGSGGGAVIVRM